MDVYQSTTDLEDRNFFEYLRDRTIAIGLSFFPNSGLTTTAGALNIVNSHGTKLIDLFQDSATMIEFENAYKQMWEQLLSVKNYHSFYSDIIQNNSIEILKNDPQNYTFSQNSPPSANAGADQVAIEGASVTLTSLSTDSDGIISSYEWKDGNTIIETNASFTKSDFSLGIHNIYLKVTDDEGDIDLDILSLTIYNNTSDLDNDGMPDEWEIANGLDPLIDDSSDDTDGDGRINLLEYQDGTNPLIVDIVTDTIIHNGVTYGIVTSPYTEKVWLDRNLGASQVCTALDDTACYGDYYQFGRDADGHQNKNSNVTAVQSDVISDIDHGDFISSPPDKEWTTIDGDASLRIEKWNSLNGSSICPVGFRVPNSEELYSEVTIGDTALETFNNFLKIPLSGFRSSNGNIYGAGDSTEVWSTTTYDDSFTDFLLIHSDNIDSATNSVRSSGRVVRCIQDNTPHNTAPVANAGVDQNVTEGTTVTLDATASNDSDGTIASYEWKEGITVLSTLSSFTKSNFSVGTHTITLTVTDNEGTTGIHTVVVTVASVAIGTITSSVTGRVWMDRNLGASRVCQSFDDAQCYGDYYQWGRDTDGHEKSNSFTSAVQATTITNVGTSFIINHTDWNSNDSSGDDRNTHWNQTDGSTVCPTGYRVPSITELEVENISDKIDAFNKLKLPSAGYRDYDGSLHNQSDSGVLSSNSQYSTEHRSVIGFELNSIRTSNAFRASGYSIRCIKD